MRAILAICLILAACNGETTYKAAIAWERFHAGVKAKVVHAADHDVHYLEGGVSGAKALENVVLVHGIGMDKDTWLYLLQALEHEYHVVSVDLPGFGDSTRDPAQSYDIPTQAQRLHAVLQAIGVHHAHFIGNSMGGAISATYAIFYPNEVRSLTLVDSAGVKPPRLSPETIVITEQDNPLVVASEADLDRLMSISLVKPPSIPSSVKRFFVDRAMKNADFTRKVFHDIRKEPSDLTERLPEIKARTLIVWGARDRIIDPSCAEVFSKGIAGSHLVVMPDTGHGPMLERPKELAKLFEHFVAEH